MHDRGGRLDVFRYLNFDEVDDVGISIIYNLLMRTVSVQEVLSGGGRREQELSM